MNLATKQYELESLSLANLGNQNFDFRSLDDRDDTGIQFIDRIEFLFIITALTQGGGGACTPYDMHNILESLTIKDNQGKAWGVENCTGVEVDASRYLARGRALPYRYDINGDATVNAGAGPVTRAFSIVWDFNAFGRPGTYTPPASFFKKSGSIKTKLAAPANNSTLTGTLTPVVYTHGEPKLRSVERIVLRSAKLNSLSYKLDNEGMLLQHALENSGAWVAADIDSLSVKANTGDLLRERNILASRDESYNENPEITAANKLRHFCDPVGGTNPYFIPVFPAAPTSEGVGSLPTGDSVTGKIVGTESPTNITALSVFVDPEDKSVADAQLISQGADRDAIASSVSSVPGGVVHNDRVRPYVGKTLATPSKVK